MDLATANPDPTTTTAAARSTLPRAVGTWPARWFHPATAVACLSIVAVGFTPSITGRAHGALPPLTPLVAVHAALFASWFGLFALQTGLVATRRVRWHRRLGVAAAVVAVAMVATVLPITLDAVRRGVLPGDDDLAFLLVLLGDVALFAGFVALALAFRLRPATHRRLMLLATFSILPPAISRWPVPSMQPAIIPIVMLLLIGATLLHDRLADGRLHRVSLWGGVVLVGSVPVRLAIAHTDAWHRVAAWLVRA
jgi:hypothetical protein